MIRMFRGFRSAILCVRLIIVPAAQPRVASSMGMAAMLAAASPQSSSAFQLPGQSFTPLPDGRWLVLGGYGASGPVDTAWVVDPSQASATKLSNSLLHSRALHTATLLPDGTVLIVGGVDGPGGLEGTVERFTPQTMAFAMVEGSGLTQRAQHTATLLTDGRLLIAGGSTQSERAAESAEVFDFRSGHGVDTDSRLHGGRQSLIGDN